MLRLLAGTRILVPRLLDNGEKYGGYYITTAYIDGLDLPNVGDECRKNNGRGHAKTGKCSKCQSIAEENAEAYIREVVLPELRMLRSDTSDLNGIVIPSPWVTQHDERSSWPVKNYGTPLVLCHGDLGPWNIRMDSSTLQVVAVVDWENAGYQLEKYLDYWTVKEGKYYAWFKDTRALDCEVRDLVE